MTLKGAGSVTRALRRSLLVGLTLLWLAGVVGSGFVLKRLIDQKSDDELHESATILLSIVRYHDDMLVAAAILGDSKPPPPVDRNPHERFVYQVRDASGRVLLHSANAVPELRSVPLVEGFADAGPWRVVTLSDPDHTRFVQLADPLSERRDALVTALWWLTLPLAVLLAFAAAIVFRASRSLAQQVQNTARAVARQDPQALGLVSLDGVVTEMRPAVEATNELLGKLADALEAERSFTYNSAHEIRTPIAAASAQAQLLAAMAKGTPLHARAEALVGALARLARLAERLLALARAEGAQPLANDWVDLAQVTKLTIAEFERDARLAGRRIVAECGSARVRGDLDAVGLAVRNLLENALVHGAGGSFIRVACRSGRGWNAIAVIDDGPGVKGIDVRRLTRRFTRAADAPPGGAGLGLSIVDTLARRMGARLELVSPPTGLARGFEARLVWDAASAAVPAAARRAPS